MTELQQQILAYVKSHQPALIADIVKDLGIYRSRYYRETAELREDGLLQAMPGVGIFAGEEGVNYWLENGGQEKLREWGREINAASQAAKGLIRPQQKDDSQKMFQRYNPRKNPVVKEYMKSEFRQRLMMVYGRAGV
ncbi:hypothetical protein ABW09_12025 [Pluralibacter gergoviae]|uniref:hypothetical protein n=1 Tax=Pluralibacter gergoviae TaxID=61647 RepID=UPI000650D3AD|nr:hypothetical protein [Pluralibacter gergoviae]KMK17768.1 hypothetical protein ABW09_12025 [Pluralibacter gergoviae]